MGWWDGIASFVATIRRPRPVPCGAKQTGTPAALQRETSNMTEPSPARPLPGPPLPGPMRSDGSRAGRPTEEAPPPVVVERPDAESFRDLEQRPVSEHVGVFEAEHARLQRELGTIDQV